MARRSIGIMAAALAALFVANPGEAHAQGPRPGGGAGIRPGGGASVRPGAGMPAVRPGGAPVVRPGGISPTVRPGGGVPAVRPGASYYGAYHNQFNYPYYPYYPRYGSGFSFSLGYYPGYYWAYPRPYVYYPSYNSYPDTYIYTAPAVDYSYVLPRTPPAQYTPPGSANVAYLTVVLPADAELWLGETKTTITGTVRPFVTPSLEPGRDYTYQIRARWKADGKDVEQTKTVDIHASDSLRIDFLAQVPAPRPAP